MEPGPNLGGPPSKAKYSLVTDSELSRATESWEEPLKGRSVNLKPRRLQAVGGLWRWPTSSFGDELAAQCLTACLLQNDPGSYGRKHG